MHTISRYYEYVGKQLKHNRLKNNLTLEQVGEKVGITFRQVKKWEDGESKIPMHFAIVLCELYGINYNKFVLESLEYLDR